MSAIVELLRERVADWPKEALDELVKSTNEIETRYFGVYKLSDDERTAVREGLAQAARGEFAADEDVAALFDRFRK